MQFHQLIIHFTLLLFIAVVGELFFKLVFRKKLANPKKLNKKVVFIILIYLPTTVLYCIAFKVKKFSEVKFHIRAG